MKGFETNTASGKNMKTVSLSKRLIMANDSNASGGFLNNTVDFMQNKRGINDLNNTALMQQQLN